MLGKKIIDILGTKKSKAFVSGKLFEFKTEWPEDRLGTYVWLVLNQQASKQGERRCELYTVLLLHAPGKKDSLPIGPHYLCYAYDFEYNISMVKELAP